MDFDHCEERPPDFRNRKSILRTLTTTRILPHPRDDVAFFRALFCPPGSGLGSPGLPPLKRPRNVMRLLGTTSLGEFWTGGVNERRFLSRLAALVPASR